MTTHLPEHRKDPVTPAPGREIKEKTIAGTLRPDQRKGILAVLWVLLSGLIPSACAGNKLDIEAALVTAGYNDVAVPGDKGTRFSLTDDLHARETAGFRLRYSRAFSRKHWIGILAAPLTMDSQGTLKTDIDFNGTTFGEDRTINAKYRFDSYRLIYRYHLHQADNLQFSFGAALKVRDASIELESGLLRAKKENTGLVPLLSFYLAWKPFRKLSFMIDGEALAASQGRAEDVLFAAEYDVNDSLALKIGYRLLEGGADNDEVYTFSLFHYAVVGAGLSF